jgi:hypothetical protein
MEHCGMVEHLDQTTARWFALSTTDSAFVSMTGKATCFPADDPLYLRVGLALEAMRAMAMDLHRPQHWKRADLGPKKKWGGRSRLARPMHSIVREGFAMNRMSIPLTILVAIATLVAIPALLVLAAIYVGQ